MKYIILFIFILGFGVHVLAQIYPVLHNNGKSHNWKFAPDSVATKHINILPSYMNFYDENPRLDINDDPCALLKVITTNDSTIQFNGNIVGDIKYTDGAYCLYLSEGSHLLNIVNDGVSTNIDLHLLGNKKVTKLEGGKTYYLCGIDNEDDIRINSIVEMYYPLHMQRVRMFASKFINMVNIHDTKGIKKVFNNSFSGEKNSIGRLCELIEAKRLSDVINHASLISVINHGTKPNVFGLTFCISDSKETLGYVFVLLDLNDAESGTPHIVTFQTNEEVLDKGVFTLDDFFIP